MAKQSEKNKRMTLWIDKDIKDRGDAIIYELGLNPSMVINLMYRQIVNHRGIPFDVKMPVDVKMPDRILRNHHLVDLMTNAKKRNDRIV